MKKTHDVPITVNHSAGKMEVDAITQMFRRSARCQICSLYWRRRLQNLQCSDILKSSPYADIDIVKKKCIGHVQKRMSSRLRECKKKNKGADSEAREN